MDRHRSIAPKTASTIPWRRIAVPMLLCACSILIAGCNTSRLRPRPRPQVDLGIALPPTWEVDTAEELDTDQDQDLEWVICYTFDNLTNEAFVPIRCAVYDMARREPKLPVFYPYHLQAPGWTFLGEGTGNVSVSLKNVLSNPQSTGKSATELDPPEVIVTNQSPNEFINRVSIYRWHDNVASELRNRTDPHEVLVVPGQQPSSGEWYECLGMFESSLKVNLQLNQVIVTERLKDRSQLARIDVYKYNPDKGFEGYLDSAQQLVAPDSSCIGFAHGIPEDIVESPYPEKIVMAFQETFNQDPDYGTRYLTADAKQSRRDGCVGQYFAKSAQDVCVKLVSYGPPNETESEIRAFGQADAQKVSDLEARTQSEVKTQATQEAEPLTFPIRAFVETWHTAPGAASSSETRIRWTLVREEASDEQSNRTRVPSSSEGQWKIVEACELK